MIYFFNLLQEKYNRAKFHYRGYTQQILRRGTFLRPPPLPTLSVSSLEKAHPEYGQQ